MDKKFLIKFAFKNLMMHRSRTILTILGVTVGISAIVFLVAFAFGIEKLVTGEVTKGNAYKLIDVGTGSVQALRINEEVVNQFRQISQVKSTEPTINIAGKAKDQDRAMDVTFSGTSDKYLEWSGLATKWGTGLDSSEIVKPIVINSALLKFLPELNNQTVLGKEILFDLVIPKELTSNDAVKINDAQFTVVGIIPDGSIATAYAKYSDVLELGAVNFSQIKVESQSDNKERIETIRKQIENLGYKTQYVGDTVAQIEQIFQIFKIILGSFGLIALIVAALGMFNTLTISLLERTKEVALLKILGMRRKDISAVFLAEAVSIGVFGGAVGVFAGYLVGLGANSLFNYFALKSGGESVSVFMFPTWFMLSIWLFAVLLGIFTGIYPARRATKINALDVLRYE